MSFLANIRAQYARNSSSLQEIADKARARGIRTRGKMPDEWQADADEYRRIAGLDDAGLQQHLAGVMGRVREMAAAARTRLDADVAR